MADHILPARPEGKVPRYLERLGRRGKAQDRAPGEGNVAPPVYDDTRLQARLKYLYVPPRGESRRSGNLSIANNTAVAVTMQAEVHDNDAIVDIAGAPTRLTIKTAGFYHVYARMTWAANGTGFRWGYVRMDGSKTLGGNVGGANGIFETYVNVSFVREFAVGEYLELMVLQTSGGALNLNYIADESPYFGAYWIGAA